ncbi:DUF2157 domain-containing protein [Cohaesibacter intestini]|uniref:DUF2157 domain-containing protein n=1 Tax=Cohaesibacter intestini TaxID=2211145 RepID=UPI0013008137|nr:DUF2157 domain-containing protein [Cohaesibacter intestini]
MQRQKKPQQAEAVDLSDIVIDRSMLDALAAKGSIDADLRRASLEWLHPPHMWAQWVVRLLLAFGAALVLTGILFFFAFNWASLPHLAKLGLIQAALLTAALGAWWFGTGRIVGQLLLITASVLVGVFMAAFGQIYQSGADAWTLFAIWAVAITPWTILSRSPFHWLVWFVLVNLALSLWWDQTIDAGSHKQDMLAMLMAALNLGLLTVREALTRGKPTHWLAPLWTRWLLLAAILVSSFPFLYEGYSDPADSMLLLAAAIIASIVIGALFVNYRLAVPDIPALAMILLLGCLLAVLLFANLLDALDMSSLGITFLTALVAIGVFALSAGYLRGLLAKAGDREGGANV